MVLMTDVGPDDQHMTYIKGTHRRVHPPGKSLRNWTDREVEPFAGFEHLDCVGKAGTVVLFDANGLHRGMRKLGATMPERDQQGMLLVWKIIGYWLGLDERLQPATAHPDDLDPERQP